jgi:hypothetical protein
MMIEKAAPHLPPATQADSMQAPSPEPSARADRVEWLFRDALRRRQVHPLMDLLRRYRDQESA